MNCPFALWRPEGAKDGGSYTGGPFRIVHHTTEGLTLARAINAFKGKNCFPHFTVDEAGIYQHLDIGRAARALCNKEGGVQTNRLSAIQIELVGFAHIPKNKFALTNMARLCRWIEMLYAVPLNWPCGELRPARNGNDPGHHNRNPDIWSSKGGHYGHSQVPENTHWDPAYNVEETRLLMAAEFDDKGALIPASVGRYFFESAIVPYSEGGEPQTTMLNH